MTLTQLFQVKSKKPSMDLSRDELVEMGVDPDFYEALPDCIKLEVLQEHRGTKPTEKLVEPIEILETSQDCPSTEDIEDMENEELSWERIRELLKLRDFERVSHLLTEVKGEEGGDELIEKTQDWFKEHVGGQLFLE